MRIAIISDVHEDFERLQKIFKSIDVNGCDSIFCLGDITGYSQEFYDHKPDANACIELIRERTQVILAGNHDLFLAKRFPTYYPSDLIPSNWFQMSFNERKEFTDNNLWLYEEEIIPVLTQDNMDFLSEISEFEIFQNEHSKVLLSHYIYPDLCGITKWFLNYALELHRHFHFMAQNDCKLSIAGHIHPVQTEIVGKFFWQRNSFEKFQVKNFPKIVFCPPVAGRNFPGGYLLLDLSSFEITTKVLS